MRGCAVSAFAARRRSTPFGSPGASARRARSRHDRARAPPLASMLHRLYLELATGALRKSFPLWQALGLHITPNHFYQPVPDTRRLDDALWAPRLDLEGVDLRVDEQLALLSAFECRFKAEYEAFPRRRRRRSPEYYMENLLFSGI